MPIEMQVGDSGRWVRNRCEGIPRGLPRLRASAGGWAARRLQTPGVLGDWDHPYLTMMPRYEAKQLRGFAAIIKNGSFVQGLQTGALVA